jgi:glycosyltransferase involved in cell wall biosynthesis
MLWDKGVAEFVEAARMIREQRLPARFVLVGDPDPANPASIPLSSLQSWTDSGIVEWWGRRTDMPAVLAESNVVCLPSYGEGLAKVLLEAAACGRAIVTTDVPGCREVVQPGENGLVVAPRNASALADAFVTLIKDPSLRARMGSRGRQIAVNEFSEDMKINETLSLYSDLLGATRFPVDPDSSK